MSAIAIDLPDDVVAARDGIVAFAEQEVIPRHQRNHELFENPRALYREDGRISDALVELIREVRVASAEAGFYHMCVPEALGGGGLGHLAYYVAWQELFHRCGPRNRLMLYVLAHWAFGPSRLLERVTPEAQERIMPGLMKGTRSMCFGLSEPGAGSDASMIAMSGARGDHRGFATKPRRAAAEARGEIGICLPEVHAARENGRGSGGHGMPERLLAMNNTFTRLASGALIVVLGSWVSTEEAAEPDLDRIRDAVVRGLKIVQKSARSYPDHRSCFSCHHQTLPVLAMATARDRGLEINHDVFREQLEFTHESFEGRARRMKEGEGVGGASMTVGYGLWALEIGKWKKDETTSAMVSFLLKKQAKDGSWKCSSNRPPLEESSFTCSILAVYYMGKFATETQREHVDAAAARAREWVLNTGPRSHEDLVSRLGALPLIRAEPDAIAAARKAVLDAQREDGGWAQLDDMTSDAYATGFTLFTLQRIGFPTDHPVYQRGVKFLLETQREDGSWFVKTRSKPIQVFFDNGDPHGKSQFISIPATSWATTALAVALPAPRQARF